MNLYLDFLVNILALLFVGECKLTEKSNSHRISIWEPSVRYFLNLEISNKLIDKAIDECGLLF